MTEPTNEDLKVSEEVHRLTLENVLDPIFITDDKGKFTFICPNIPHILGYSVNEVESMGHISKLLGDSLFDFEELERNGKIENIETEICDNKGNKHFYIVTVKRISIYAGTVLYTCRNITEQKKAEIALRQSKQRLESLWSITKIADADIKTISDHILIEVQKMTNSEYAFYGFISTDQKAMDLHAWSKETISDCKSSDKTFHFPIDKAGIWADAVRKRRILTLNNFRANPPGKKGVPNGHVTLNRLMVDPLVMDNVVVCIAAVANKPDEYTSEDEQQVQAFLGNVQILIDRRKTELERHRLESQLRQSQKMEAIGTLAGGIAHEFNNMLGVIIGNTELAIDDIPEWSPAADCIQEIRTASLRAKDVVRKLLSVARKAPESRKPIQICTIINESLNLIRKTIPSSIEIRSNLACTTETILADPTEINQVLLNLCTNSVHAMSDGKGVLEVTLDTITLDSPSSDRFENIGPGDYVKLTVSDDGKGMVPDIMDRIFEPYFTTKEVDQGLGMGLAVVHGIVKKNDGDIKVQSAVGKGTTVEVLFPLIEEQLVASHEGIEALPTGTERILFVDDEASLVRMVTQMLTRSGYEVVGKTSSASALKEFEENPERFDLVITDMTMPEMTGDELAREIIQVRPDIPVILCTGHSDHMDENKAKRMGIKAFAMKPLVKADLTKTVRKVLDEAKSVS